MIVKIKKFNHCLFYGGICTVLYLACPTISGGDFNLAMSIGGILFHQIYGKGIVYIYAGCFTGGLVSQALFFKFFSVRKRVQQDKLTLEMKLRGRGKKV